MNKQINEKVMMEKRLREEREKRLIGDIVDLKFRFNPSHDYHKQFEYAVTKVAKKLRDMTSNTGDIRKAELLKEYVSYDENITVDINPANPKTYYLIESVVYSKNYTRKNKPKKKDGILEAVPIEVTVTDKNDRRVSFLSLLNMELNKKVRSLWNLYSYKSHQEHEGILADVCTVLAEVYLANTIYKYTKNNEEMRKFTLLKLIGQGQQLHENHIKFFQKEFKKFNLPEPNNWIKSKNSKYVDWYFEKPDTMFGIATLYHESKRSKKYYPFAPKYGAKEDKILYFLKAMLEEDIEIMAEVVREVEIYRSYARSWQTKKNIPDYILEAMGNNRFLEHFDYVEYDEAVDLKLIQKIEAEFIKFAKFVGLKKIKGNSLRFRKLGNHKAAGLFFPHANAVCVDWRTNPSIVHEVFHMLDFNLLEKNDKKTISTRLSSLYDFRSIVEEYRYLTNNAVNALPKENGFRVMWNSKNKYNKDYFHTSEEIFARCGEIYVGNILGFNSNLLSISEEENVIYPTDAKFLRMIQNYFSGIFETYKNNQTENNESESKPIIQEKSKVAAAPRQDTRPIFSLAIVGSSCFDDYEFFKERLDYFLSKKSKTHQIKLMVGAAKRTDQMTKRYVTEKGYILDEWTEKENVLRKFSKIMEKADGCVAFWNKQSTGTKRYIDMAKRKNISTKIISFVKQEKKVG